MRIFQIHNRYLIRGGEDTVIEQEAQFFRQLGHTVGEFIVSNDEISKFTLSRKVRLALGLSDSDEIQARLKDEVSLFKPDVVHVYNTFPLLRFEFIEWLLSQGIPSVLAISNYRAGCLNAEYFRDGEICRLCDTLGSKIPGVALRCYHSSLSHSLGSYVFSNEFAAFINGPHHSRLQMTYLNRVQEGMLKSIGASEANIFYKPNFLIEDPGVGDHKGDYALFVGRLSEAKGIKDILNAWTDVPGHLKIVGEDSKEWHHLKCEGVEFLGARSREDVYALMRDAKFLVFASKWFEGMPMVLLEALAAGLPVLVPDIESISWLASSGDAGWLFSHKDPLPSLAEKARAAFLESPETMTRMSANARARYLKLFSADSQFRIMTELYKRLGLDLLAS